MTRYGPGDPETWGPPTGHPGDPRTDEAYGPCRVCGEESTTLIETGVDADEDGLYPYAIFEHYECDEVMPLSVTNRN